MAVTDKILDAINSAQADVGAYIQAQGGSFQAYQDTQRMLALLVSAAQKSNAIDPATDQTKIAGLPTVEV